MDKLTPHVMFLQLSRDVLSSDFITHLSERVTRTLSRDFALHNYSNSKMAAHLNAEIILVVTASVAVGYK